MTRTATRRPRWWHVMLIVYGSALIAALIDDLVMSRIVAASLAGFAVEVFITWDDDLLNASPRATRKQQ